MLEHLKKSLVHQNHSKVKLQTKEALGEAEVFCIFCSSPADYFVSICQPCVDKFSVPAANFVGVEKLEEKDIENLSEKVAAKIGEKSSFEVEKIKTELNEAKAKLADAEGKVKVAEGACAEANGKLATTNRAMEDLKKLVPGVNLLANPPVLMAVSEHIASLNRIGSKLPSAAIERCWGLGAQRMSQELHGTLNEEKQKATEKLKDAKVLGRSVSP